MFPTTTTTTSPSPNDRLNCREVFIGEFFTRSFFVGTWAIHTWHLHIQQAEVNRQLTTVVYKMTKSPAPDGDFLWHFTSHLITPAYDPGFIKIFIAHPLKISNGLLQFIMEGFH